MNSPVKVETGISIPPPHPDRGRGRKARYPFATMGIGESFSVPLDGQRYDTPFSSDRSAQRIMCAAAVWRKRHASERVFTTRVLKNEGVVRCWRVA